MLATLDDMIYEVMQSEKSKKELERSHHAQGEILNAIMLRGLVLTTGF